ncbi:MAG: glycosyltransferase [Candidatus Electrothrix sp. AW2]|nr:glycosyltransferase [Candidatus Electrothrix gigas]
MNKTVSVLIPVYNEEKYIRRCLDSLLSQTMTDFEIIVIDDGSTDNTVKILTTYGDPRLIIHQQTNQGRAAARNKALELSQGEYIILQDADDWSVPNRLELQLYKAKKIGGKPIVGCGLAYQHEGAIRTSCKLFPETNKKIRNTLARPIMAGAICPGTILGLREHIVELGGWREKFHIAAEDGDLISRLYEDSETIFGNVYSPLYYYRQNPGSVTNKPHETIPAQMFKRFCTRRRRNNQAEPETFEEYMRDIRATFIKRILFKIEFIAWTIYIRSYFK